MPRHLMGDVHEQMNEVPSVLLSSETTAKGMGLG